MIKLMALYDHPEDADAFNRHYRDVHTPIVLEMPHLRGFHVSRPVGDGSPYFLVAEMHYDSAAELERSMDSDAGKAAVEDLGNFAGAGVTVVTVETESIA
jgi:uncharacterized protein (TIGR02118 family)